MLHRQFRVLFVCLGDACYSLMAESVARKLAPDIIEPSSAALYPVASIAVPAQQTLLANHYSIAGLSSKSLHRNALKSVDLIINLSGRSLAPLFAHMKPAVPALSQKVQDWHIDALSFSPPATYQKILEALEWKVLSLADRLRSGQ